MTLAYKTKTLRSSRLHWDTNTLHSFRLHWVADANGEAPLSYCVPLRVSSHSPYENNEIDDAVRVVIIAVPLHHSQDDWVQLIKSLFFLPHDALFYEACSQKHDGFRLTNNP